MFIKSEKHPSPPFTRNYLTHKMLNKKVKGEGLKTLFYIYARQGKKRKGTLGSKIGKTLNKEYNIRFKIYPSPFTSSPQHISIIVFPTEVSQVSPTRPERAEAPSPGHRPGCLWAQTCRPVRAKAFKYLAIYKAFALTGRLADCHYTQGDALG